MNLVNPSLLVQNPKIKPVYQVEETYICSAQQGVSLFRILNVVSVWTRDFQQQLQQYFKLYGLHNMYHLHFFKIYLFLLKQGWRLTTQSELLYTPPPSTPIWLQPPSFIWSLYASLGTKKIPWRKLRRTMLMPSAAIYLYRNRMPHRIFKEIFQNSFPNNLTKIPNIQGQKKQPKDAPNKCLSLTLTYSPISCTKSGKTELKKLRTSSYARKLK